MVTSERLPTIRNRAKITVDRVTTLEVQFAQLAAEGKIGDDWWHHLTSEHYPSDTSRPTEITLGECNVGRAISPNENAKDVVASVNGVKRNGDPYEFAAWLRAMPKAGLEYWLAALDTLWRDPFCRQCAPFVFPIDGERCVGGDRIEDLRYADLRFLVFCE